MQSVYVLISTHQRHNEGVCPTQNYQHMDMPMLDQGTAVFQTLQHLSSLIQSLKHPLGNRDTPARICRDLQDCEQRMHDGDVVHATHT